MAVYKVAQDVEADDKLIGPFSFRQFVYLLIVAGSIAVAFGLSRLFLPLFIIPLPVILFFGALALPLKKDQPMEIYMAALVSFYLKPRKRLWIPDGIESLVEITAPKVIEESRTKDLSQSEAERRLSYLADIADSEGWAIRHTAMPMDGNAATNSMVSDVFYEARQTPDLLDASGGLRQSFDHMIDQADERRRQHAIDMMRQATAPNGYVQQVQPFHPADPYAGLGSQPANDIYQTNTPVPPNQGDVEFNPYPTNIHQHVVQPLDKADQVLIDQPAPQNNTQQKNDIADKNTVKADGSAADHNKNSTPSTSEEPISPDIISLASNTDLSIEAIAREANRIHQKKNKKAEDGEVFISLR